MSDETTLIASHKADEGKRARAKTKTKEKQASALRAKMFLETKVEICRFHVSNMAGRSEVVVSGRQKNCKRIVKDCQCETPKSYGVSRNLKNDGSRPDWNA